jgi:glycosyltransferase involved in cell wall biosynthesis
MKILHVSPYPPARDGIGDYSAALVAGAIAAGHEARVVAARPAAQVPPEVLGALPGSAAGRRALLGAIAAWGPDVVHVQFAVAAYGARIPRLCRLLAGLHALGVPIVVTLHEITRDVASLRGAGRAVYDRVVRHADMVVVHADSALPSLAGLDRADVPVTVIPHPRAELPATTGTAAQRRSDLGLDGAAVVLAFGFIHVDKALDDLVRSVALLSRQPGREDVRLLVAGTVRPRNGPFRVFELRDHVHLRQVKRLIAASGLQDRVVFSGYVAREDVVPTFGLADVVALPYRRIEDSGVANLAAAAGARIVATDIGNLGLYVANPDWLAPVGRPDALAAALADALDAAGDGSRPTLPGVSFSEVLDRTLDLYEGSARHAPAEVTA